MDNTFMIATAFAAFTLTCCDGTPKNVVADASIPESVPVTAESCEQASILVVPPEAAPSASAVPAASK